MEFFDDYVVKHIDLFGYIYIYIYIYSRNFNINYD